MGGQQQLILLCAVCLVGWFIALMVEAAGKKK